MGLQSQLHNHLGVYNMNIGLKVLHTGGFIYTIGYVLIELTYIALLVLFTSLSMGTMGMWGSISEIIDIIMEVFPELIVIGLSFLISFGILKLGTKGSRYAFKMFNTVINIYGNGLKLEIVNYVNPSDSDINGKYTVWLLYNRQMKIRIYNDKVKIRKSVKRIPCLELRGRYVEETKGRVKEYQESAFEDGDLLASYVNGTSSRAHRSMKSTLKIYGDIVTLRNLALIINHTAMINVDDRG